MQEYEAVERRQQTVVEDRPKALRGMRYEVRHRHLPRQQEYDRADEQADQHQQTTDHLEGPGSPAQGQALGIAERRLGRKAEQLLAAVLHEQEGGDDPSWLTLLGPSTACHGILFRTYRPWGRRIKKFLVNEGNISQPLVSATATTIGYGQQPAEPISSDTVAVALSFPYRRFPRPLLSRRAIADAGRAHQRWFNRLLHKGSGP